jgi:hypothetical protein
MANSYGHEALARERIADLHRMGRDRQSQPRRTGRRVATRARSARQLVGRGLVRVGERLAAPGVATTSSA